MGVGGPDEEDDGGEEGEGGVEDPLVLDHDHWARLDDGRLEEPGEAQTDEDVEDVAADGVADGHVAQALLHHGDAGEGVLDADPGRHQGEAHHRVRHRQGEPWNMMDIRQSQTSIAQVVSEIF